MKLYHLFLTDILNLVLLGYNARAGKTYVLPAIGWIKERISKRERTLSLKKELM